MRWAKSEYVRVLPPNRIASFSGANAAFRSIRSERSIAQISPTSYPAKAGYPVNIEWEFAHRTCPTPPAVFIGSPAGACHRAALRADPLAGDDDTACGT